MTVDYLVKVGGSLLNNIVMTKAFVTKLADDPRRFVITVGSGPMGDSFNALGLERKTQLPHNLSVGCWAAIQSINARLLCAMNDRLELAQDYETIEGSNSGAHLVIDALYFVSRFAHLHHQTTDVRSAQIAGDLHCRKMIIFTDVNGIYRSDPKGNPAAERVSALAATDALLSERTSVDQGLPDLLITYGITAYVAGAKDFAESSQQLDAYLSESSTVIFPA